jgi:hypothetical protein
MRSFYRLGGGGEARDQGLGARDQGSNRGIFVQQFSIFPRFLRCEWAGVSTTLEGIFLMFAKLGEVRGKFLRTKVQISTFSFSLDMFRIG